MATTTNGIRTVKDETNEIIVRHDNKWVSATATHDYVAGRIIRWTMTLRNLNTGKEYFGIDWNTSVKPSADSLIDLWDHNHGLDNV